MQTPNNTEVEEYRIPPERIMICVDSQNKLIILGRGTFATVYKGEYKKQDDTEGGKFIKIAVKRMHALVEENGKIFPENTYNADMIKNMKKEIRNMSKLHHENVVKMYGYFEIEKRLYVVMERMEKSLEDVIKDAVVRKNLTVKKRISIASQICNGLSYIHSMGFIHRDLKPKNILVNDNRGNFTVKIGDLGGCRKIETVHNSRSCFSILYCPPEVMNQQFEYSYKSDVYSLGAVFYNLLTLKDPTGFPIMEYPVLENEFKEMGEIMKLCLQKKPDNRIKLKEVVHFVDCEFRKIKLENDEEEPLLDNIPEYVSYWETWKKEKKTPKLDKPVHLKISYIIKDKYVGKFSVIFRGEAKKKKKFLYFLLILIVLYGILMVLFLFVGILFIFLYVLFPDPVGVIVRYTSFGLASFGSLGICCSTWLFCIFFKCCYTKFRDNCYSIFIYKKRKDPNEESPCLYMDSNDYSSSLLFLKLVEILKMDINGRIDHDYLLSMADLFSQKNKIFIDEWEKSKLIENNNQRINYFISSLNLTKEVNTL